MKDWIFIAIRQGAPVSYKLTLRTAYGKQLHVLFSSPHLEFILFFLIVWMAIDKTACQLQEGMDYVCLLPQELSTNPGVQLGLCRN